MFQHHGSDAPEGTLAHDGYRLYLATLRLQVVVYKAMGIRAVFRWLVRRNAH